MGVRLLRPTGETVILAVMGPGDVVGEMAVVASPHERTASVHALDDVTMRVLRRGVHRLRRSHPEVNDFSCRSWLAGRTG